MYKFYDNISLKELEKYGHSLVIDDWCREAYIKLEVYI